MAFLKVQNLLIDDKKKICHTSLPEFVFNSANYGTNIVLYLVLKV